MTGSTSGRLKGGGWALGFLETAGPPQGNAGGVRTRQAKEPAGRPWAGNGKPPILLGPGPCRPPPSRLQPAPTRGGGQTRGGQRQVCGARKVVPPLCAPLPVGLG